MQIDQSLSASCLPTPLNDEAKRYGAGDLREVYFYRSQLQGRTEPEYHPGS
jgi:hypothetical protein